MFVNALSDHAKGCVLQFCSTVRALTRRLTHSVRASLAERLARMKRSHIVERDDGFCFLKQREKENVMDVRTLTTSGPEATCSYLLRFASLYDPGRAVAVPCNAAGVVDMDTLSQRLQITYLGARALIGREYACPTVQFAC